MLDRETQRLSERIEEVFNAASEQPADLRAKFLDLHLNPKRESDVAVRAEVERLLIHNDRAGILDETLVRFANLTAPAAPALQPGEMVAGRFVIGRMLGSGGMGEVYEAEDRTAGQTVALKTIRPDMAGDASQAERFRRELLISRNLAHRNVCKVFEYNDIDRGPQGRLRFFTMELLRGETLAQRLAAVSRLPPDKALAILEQVAAGLEEVHRNGIIHRDLKPSNIFLVRDADGSERPVVMDFGLARNITDSELRQTRTGMMVGTRLYMAPELSHLAGVSSDVYSFGVIAFEMVTGTPSPLVAPRSLVHSLDPMWDKVLLACFSLDPAKRPASAIQAVSLLRRRTRPWRRLVLATAAVAAALLAGVAVWRAISPADAPATALNEITRDSGFTINPTSSADGKLIAYASDRDSAGDLNIWLQNLDTGETRQLTNDPFDEDDPALSPDGKLIAWRSSHGDGIFVRPVSGGTPRKLAQPAFSPRFSPDGRYIAYWDGVNGERDSPGRVWVIPAAGGTPRNIAEHFFDARIPSWSPDGNSIIFRGAKERPEPGSPLDDKRDWWIGSLDGKSQQPTGFGERLHRARLQYHESPVLWDGSRMVFAGRPDKGNNINLWSIGYFGFPSFGMAIGAPRNMAKAAGFQDVPVPIAGGRIAYANWHEAVHIYRLDVASGVLLPETSDETIDTRVSSSADGNILVFGRREGQFREMWTRDLRASPGPPRLLGTDAVQKQLKNLTGLAIPFVSPDGRFAAFSTGAAIRRINIATGEMSLDCSDCGDLRGWMPDSSGVLYYKRVSDTQPAIGVFDLAAKSRKILISGPGVYEAAVSPDAKTLAFTVRNNGTHSALFVTRLTQGGVTGDPLRLTPEDTWADKPVWSTDGKTLYFSSEIDGFSCIWSAQIDPVRLRLPGDMKVVRHFHKAAETLSHLSPETFGMGFGGGGLFLSVSISSGNIWALSP